MKQSPVPERVVFDPIRQHMHFCPWITLTGSSLPGWKQTLYALQRQSEFFSSSPVKSLSSSLIAVYVCELSVVFGKLWFTLIM